MTVFHECDIQMHMCKIFDFRCIRELCYYLYDDRGYASSEFVMRLFADKRRLSGVYRQPRYVKYLCYNRE
ncbi:hypothetical protein PHYBLDRAFT_139420 [Phycomyces blakesleeanus NRRL 1555(-)]|uniref:Uncharacterized protein n=1 Tax=Phycomyces blakesleeanus (strain ATCC 8743b / DSM 1359 / FGSC 10004 / NBRC 33097 / NRRL 1555) TaxID=763407 RepID=A0A167QAX7_PHYB8|nr:hypothetical protein PHYBLDRAFT_139420 [Phycomyces blakesleeanus NRRL 1555(-)]OAD79389.1 hypothetical protein PHYBLDRAFT_139420 [Phycomyces blakesleeanus NRRL 1555(-)]|eukprot:XP_018297429.1 hypothetical protein PHYBLDRAFT_139420 [Phycomyces blakesleeanus NRRL 1555(-)]